MDADSQRARCIIATLAIKFNFPLLTLYMPNDVSTGSAAVTTQPVSCSDQNQPSPRHPLQEVGEENSRTVASTIRAKDLRRSGSGASTYFVPPSTPKGSASP